jgi:hypothetical protein
MSQGAGTAPLAQAAAKTELVAALQVTLQERRLQVSPALPHASTLLTELQD